MCYNLLRFLSRTTLVLAIVLFSVKAGYAQGTVSLADDFEEDELGIDSNVPDEISLFDSEENDFDTGLIQPTSRVETTTTITETTTTTQNNAPTTSTVSLVDDTVDALPEYNNPLPTPTAPVVIDDNFGEDLLTQIDDKLFSQMSDIEKQTALLTLELRRERIKTEIEAIRMQRQKALELEQDAKELKARQKAEWETEQQRKLIVEQTKLQEENIKLEKLRQEKVINAYKNDMLKTNQKWIEALNTAYAQTKVVENERTEYLEDFKTKLANLTALSQKVGAQAITAKENYDREIQNLQTQISILNSRIETLNKEKAESANAAANGVGINNPFASGPALGTTSDPEISLNEEYLILEVRGKGEEISAKISNKSGAESFFVKKGTTLKSGHIIEEITPTFIRADKNGEKEFIYFSAGGVLDKEPDADVKLKNVPMGRDVAPSSEVEKKKVYVSDSFIEQMFAE